MRNKHYKVYSFRLNDTTRATLSEFKSFKNTSYNLLFLEMIIIYKKHGGRDLELKILKKKKKKIQSLLGEQEVMSIPF